jgi:uncharacterized protein
MTSESEPTENSSSSSADPPGDQLRVVDNPDAHRYVGYEGTEIAGFLDYHSQPGLLTILHTEVGRSYEGHGVGSGLIAHALDDARQRGMQVLPICPFVISYIKKHPEYKDLLRFQ